MKPLRLTSNSTTRAPWSVLLADDHAIVRIGLRVIIGNITKDIHIEDAPNGGAIVSKLKTRRFDLLVLDINMRQTESFSLVTYLRRAYPSLKILIYTTSDEATFATRFLRIGVSGYLQKRSDEIELITAFKAMMEGKTFISTSLSHLLYGQGTTGEEPNSFGSLTNREFEVALQILKGNSPKEIAEILHLNESTVGTHKYRILKKLEVRSVVDLIQLAQKHKLI
jgi:DNA-binding NarL/FixJ family response regulator